MSTLRLLAGDLKADKAWRHYAAAQVRRPPQDFMCLLHTHADHCPITPYAMIKVCLTVQWLGAMILRCLLLQEMIGIAVFMARGAMSEVMGAFKEAFYRYNSAMPRSALREGVRHATRAMILAAEYARQHGLYNEANYALMKAHFQVMQADCFLFMTTPPVSIMASYFYGTLTQMSKVLTINCVVYNGDCMLMSPLKVIYFLDCSE